MKAAVVRSFDRPLEIEDLPIPEPGAEQAPVRIEACGGTLACVGLPADNGMRVPISGTVQRRPVPDATGRADRIEAGLRAAGIPARAEQERRYLKSELHHYGASVPAIRSVAKAALAAESGLSHDDLVAVVVALWERPVHECRMAAVELLDLGSGHLVVADLDLVERLIRESRTWALVDGLAASVAGGLVERFPELSATLDRWAADDNFWMRRSALLALLEPLRRGEGDFERFARYADAMLEEREFFTRKAIGWVLRETSKRQPDRVSAWLEPRAGRASGVTVREAVKYLSDAQRETILAAYRAGRPERPRSSR